MWCTCMSFLWSQPYLRYLCKKPEGVRWKNFLGVSAGRTLRRAISMNATTWKILHPGVVSVSPFYVKCGFIITWCFQVKEMRYFIKNICEDEFSGREVKCITTAEIDILPEVQYYILHNYPCN